MWNTNSICIQLDKVPHNTKTRVKKRPLDRLLKNYKKKKPRKPLYSNIIKKKFFL